jgi:hypothetical protein
MFSHLWLNLHTRITRSSSGYNMWNQQNLVGDWMSFKVSRTYLQMTPPLPKVMPWKNWQGQLEYGECALQC